MFSIHIDKLRTEIETIEASVTLYDSVRAMVYPEDKTTDPGSKSARVLVGGFRSIAPQLVQWRIYDHCAAITRLYAVYQQFVSDLVTEWLSMLPTLYLQYSDLPEPVRKGHRLGVADVLSKLGGSRYQHLSEENVLEGIYGGVTGSGVYSLLVDAYLIDEQNLRADILQGLLSRIGVSDAWGWVCRHRDVQHFLDEVRGNSGTVESELASLVFERNAAAHGSVSNILSTEEIRKMAQFIMSLGTALSEVLMKMAVDRLLVLGRARKLGRVIHVFRDCVIGVEMEPVTGVKVGDEIAMLHEYSCFKTTIGSMEIDHVRYEVLDTNEVKRVGIKLTRKARIGSHIVLLAD